MKNKTKKYLMDEIDGHYDVIKHYKERIDELNILIDELNEK